MAYIYILENKDVQRIKIGATVNNPNDRLLDISRMWGSIKGRCQICLSWRMLVDGRMPDHVKCTGSRELPLEYSTQLAEEQLAYLQEQLPLLSYSDLNFARKRIKNLTKILLNYKENSARLGVWELRASFQIDSAYLVEEHVHLKLENYLDRTAPFGEVFTCPPEEAIAVVENVIVQLENQ